MGTDIHAYLEYRTASEWQCLRKLRSGMSGHTYLPELGVERKYPLFGLLFPSIRVNFEDQYLPVRGFPYRSSLEVEEEYRSWGEDAHSASWATLAELKQKATELMITANTHELHQASQGLQKLIFKINTHLAPIKFRTLPPENIRMVFWFDN